MRTAPFKRRLVYVRVDSDGEPLSFSWQPYRKAGWVPDKAIRVVEMRQWKSKRSKK